MMKHILRKLHIGSSQDGFENRNQVVGGLNPNEQDPSVASTSWGLPGWLANPRHNRRPSSSSTASTPRQQRADQSSAGGQDSPSSDPPLNFNYYEEEYQVQLALALSVSNQNVLDDPESLQIRAAKRISLGRPPSPGSTPGESTAHRYWNYNVLDFDEKVVDGFYDVYGVVSDFGNADKLPSLVDLQNTPLTGSLGYEVVLVNRAIDPDLVQLEQAALCLCVDCGMTGISLQSSDLVQKIAELVVQHMGGPVLDANEMHSRWVVKSYELRTSLNNIVLPLGCLKIGLSRHRALLFKVLADHVGISCRLVKGSHYTGTDEGAVNIVKLDSEREYIVDLMGAPGTLLPAEPVGGAPNIDVSENPSVVAEFPPLIEKTWNVLISDKEVQCGSNSSSKKTNCIAATPNGYQGKDVMFLPTELKNTIGCPTRSSEVDVMSLTYVPSGKGPHVSSETRNIVDGLHPVQLDPEIKGKKDASTYQSDSQLQQNINESLNSGYMECWNKHVNNKGDPVLENVAEWEIPWEEIVIGERIGLGSYGEVHHGDWHGTEVAVKRFLDQDFFGDALDEFISEVQIMRRMQHPNVVLFLGAVTRPPNLSIVTEFLPRGSLFRLLHRPNNQLDEKLRLKMAIDVAEGMNYLHTSKPIIVHRDLKSPNLLVDKNWVVKVCDFGLSRMKHHTFLSSKSTAGTPEWMAPEVLRNELSNEKCDVYSFGVILWELCTLQQPWSGMNPMQVVGAVGFQNRRLEIPKNVDPDVAKVISSCWQSDPRLRPSFSELTMSLKRLERLLIVEY